MNSLSHRGPVPFYVLAVTTPEEGEAATRTLIHAAQKCALDLPALLLDPRFKNRLVFWLRNTRITPNQVTVCTGVFGAGIAYLFLHGWLRLGITLAYAVEVLDGVDGKLARTRLQTSRLGVGASHREDTRCPARISCASAYGSGLEGESGRGGERETRFFPRPLAPSPSLFYLDGPCNFVYQLIDTQTCEAP